MSSMVEGSPTLNDEPSGGDMGEELDFGMDDDTLMRLLDDPIEEHDCVTAPAPAAPRAPPSLPPPTRATNATPLVPLAPLLPTPGGAPMMPMLFPKAEAPAMVAPAPHFSMLPPHLLAMAPAAALASAPLLQPAPRALAPAPLLQPAPRALAPAPLLQRPAQPSPPQQTVQPVRRMVKDIAPMPMPVDTASGVKRKEAESIDGYTEGMTEAESKELKKQKRLIRNRMSAQLHRERQKAHVDQLEAQLQEKDTEISRLREQVEVLSKENVSYRQELELLRASVRGRRRGLGGGGNMSDGYTTTSTVSSGGNTPEHQIMDGMEVNGYASDGSAGGARMGGVALMSAFFLFTFIAAPSTLLLRSSKSSSTGPQASLALPSWISRRFASPSASAPQAVPAITWSPQGPQGPSVPAAPLSSRVLEEVLSESESVRHLAAPMVPVAAPSRSTAVAPYASRALLAVQDVKVDRRSSPEVLTSSAVPQHDEKKRRVMEVRERGYVLDPVESMPAKWRDTSTGAPWKYKESLYLFEHSSQHVNASTVRAAPLFVSTKEQATADAGASSSSSTRLRGQTGGNQVDVYRNDKGNKQVDVYRHHDPEGTSAAGSKGTSYMFCPQAYGMMSGDMSRVYWSRVRQQAGEKESQAPGSKEIRVAPFNAAPAIVLPSSAPGAAKTSASGQNESTPAPDGDVSSAPYLVLLVPSDTMDWGTGTQGPTSEQRAYWEKDGDSRTWLEVGCRLTSVRVVNDVRFSV